MVAEYVLHNTNPFTCAAHFDTHLGGRTGSFLNGCIKLGCSGSYWVIKCYYYLDKKQLELL